MPIRLNLLAEAQAAEDMRRRDPVKRAVWVGVFLIFLVLLWSSTLWVKTFTDNSGLTALQTSLTAKTNEYNTIIANEAKLYEMTNRLAALYAMVTNRFYYAPMLDAFQHSPVEGIQFTKLHTDQVYEVVAEGPPVKANGKTLRGTPAAATEKIRISLDARDTSENPGGDQIKLFKETLAQNPYFVSMHVSTNDIVLGTLMPPATDAETGKNFVLFSLECRYPNHTRTQ
jgi:hypothetical protein